MRLRNKKTGEIIDIYNGEITLHCNHGRKTIHFKRLEDLEEWEDYEKPKEYWWIDCVGDIYNDTEDGFDTDKKCKQIGNYFETKEEAEKAVEKLKAWKRLKENGFRFDKVSGCWIEYSIKSYNSEEECEQTHKDLNLLFGGEE